VILDAHKQAAAAINAERSPLRVGLTIAMQYLQAVAGGEAVRDASFRTYFCKRPLAMISSACRRTSASASGLKGGWGRKTAWS
jgi:hypothetical protein